jgi:hypothetical protein
MKSETKNEEIYGKFNKKKKSQNNRKSLVRKQLTPYQVSYLVLKPSMARMNVNFLEIYVL